MKHPRQRHNFFRVTMIALLLAVVVPTTALGQGRGRGWGRGGIFGSSHNKCGKFVNCHDARDGRWDGRGPRANRVGLVIPRNRIRYRNRWFDNNQVFWRDVRRHRNRQFDNDDFFRDRRFRSRNRDFDGDRDFFRNRRFRHH